MRSHLISLVLSSVGSGHLIQSPHFHSDLYTSDDCNVYQHLLSTYSILGTGLDPLRYILSFYTHNNFMRQILLVPSQR